MGSITVCIIRRACLFLAIAIVIIAGCGGEGGARKISISPTSATLRPGQVAFFAARSGIGTHPVYFEWSVGGGDVALSYDHSSILYTAGSVEGDYSVVVKDTKSGASARANVTIQR